MDLAIRHLHQQVPILLHGQMYLMMEMNILEGKAMLEVYLVEVVVLEVMVDGEELGNGVILAEVEVDMEVMVAIMVEEVDLAVMVVAVILDTLVLLQYQLVAVEADMAKLQ